MKITNVGYNYTHPIGFTIDRPHGSGDYILLILRSEAFFVLNGTRMITPADSAIIFKKGTPQLYGSAKGEYINDWIHFDLETDDINEFDKLGIPFDTVIPLGETIELSQYIKTIFMELHSKNMHKEKSAERYFELLLFKLSEKINRPAPQKDNYIYQTLCALRNEIQLTPQNEWNIDQISQKIQMSRSYIQHLYKRFFGMSITEDIQNSRMEYAKYLLSSTNEKISSIAKSCGYENDVHFMRLFKKQTAMTPSEFRSGAFRGKKSF